MSSRNLDKSRTRPSRSRTGASQSRQGASRVSGSSRRETTATGGSSSAPVHIKFMGRDVTPVTLLSGKAREAATSQGKTSLSARSVSDSGSAQQAADLPLDHLSSGISRSALSVVSSTGESEADDMGFDLTASVEDAGVLDADPEASAEEVRLELSEAELNANVTLTLSESDTEVLFFQPSRLVLQDTEEHARVTARNERYAAFVKSGGGDNFVVRHTQTLNNAQKNKEVTAAPPAARDAGVTATSWAIYDAAEAEETVVGQDADLDMVGQTAKEDSSVDPRANMTDLERAVDEAVAASLASPGCLLDVDGTVEIAPPREWENREQSEPQVFKKTGRGGAGAGAGMSTGTGNTGTGGVSGTARSSMYNSTRGSTKTNTHRSEAGKSRSIGAAASNSSRGGRTSGDATGVSTSGSRRVPRGIIIPTKKPAATTSGTDGWSDAKDSRDILLARESARVLSSHALLKSLRTVERAIQQNLYHTAHRAYRSTGSNLFDVLGDSLTAKQMAEDGGGDAGGGGGDTAAAAAAAAAADADATAADGKSEGGGKDGDEGGDAGGGDAAAAAAAAAAAEAAGGVGGGPGAPAPAVHARLDKLWSYHCDLTRGRNVSSMAWNRMNQDLLAVSYGQYDIADQKGGLILFWSLKNPEYPDCVLRTTTGVTALAFSVAHPNLLAAGLYDGTVSIYDVRKALAGEGSGAPELSTHPLEGAHNDAVWQVKWVNKGAERGERLVSIGADGRVTEWSTKKGMVSNDLMRLKRVRTADTSVGERGEGVISRADSGLCIDFPDSDTSIYYAGTEDGVIHHCSVSYNEQYLESFHAHTGPVNALRISPYLHNAILTASADWSIRLWDMGSGMPATVYQTTDAADAVTDVSWSPQNATSFASVTGDGRVMVWDTKSLTPVIDHRAEVAGGTSSAATTAQDGDEGAEETKDGGGGPAPTAKRLTRVLFAQNAPVLVTGDETGCVDVYKLVGLPPPPPTVDEQTDALSKSLHPA